MSDENLLSKKAYFHEQDLLDVSDDEQYQMSRTSKIIESALRDVKIVPPPTLIRCSSSINGPTPKELQALQAQAAFEAHTRKERAATRPKAQKLERSSTESVSNVAKSFPVTQSKHEPPAVRGKRGSKLKRTTSLPEVPVIVPFYKRMGEVPRTLTQSRRKAVLADAIKVRPEERQLLKGKIVYFYPNDDDDTGRRMRLHKIIELGAAWVKSWRNDVTHIVTDYQTATYDGLLSHLKKEGLSVSTAGCTSSSLKVGGQEVLVVPFQPYLTESMGKGVLENIKCSRFRIPGAPTISGITEVVEAAQLPISSQSSLKIKSSGRQHAAQGSQETASHPKQVTSILRHAAADTPAPVLEDRVEDSFIMPSSEPGSPKAENRFNDELSLAIEEAKAIAHLPLDDDDDDDLKTNNKEDADESGTDEEPSKSASTSRSTFNLSKASMIRDKKSPLMIKTFQCMDPGASGYTSSNPNARTIQVLEEMCKHYDQMQDQWRTLSYQKCITTLKKQSVKITTAKQAIALPSIGQRLADKIEGIVLTDRLRKLDNTRDDPADAVLRLFLGIYGAGLVQANKWIAAGYRTLDDLRLHAKLSDDQIVGIEHYDDFNSRIPRAEVEAHGAYVKASLRKINLEFEATVMGSYRRGAQDSGDIDMIITCPNAGLATIRAVVFEQLVPHLFNQKFLTASLATSRSHDPSGSKWHGASCLPGSSVWRRMDLLIVPEEEMGAALIYFTGNDIFNRSIRLLARKKGMRLNQKGLYKDVRRGRRGEKLNEGVFVEGRSEKKIFEVLGVPWREPHERIC